MLTDDPARVAGVPKSDLHSHALLALPRQEMERWHGSPIRPFRYEGNGIHDVNRWIIDVYSPVFTRPGAFRAALTAAFIQARNDGVSLLEMSLDAGFGELTGIPPREVADTLRSVHRETAPEIDFRPELGFARPLPLKKLTSLFAAYLELDYFRAIDLYDDESGQPVGNFKELYRLARKAGLKCKAHAGEFGTAASVREAVEMLGLDAVQHGIGAASSPEVMKWLAGKKVPLNICPTSNVILGRVKSIRDHPIRILYDYGVKVTVNSDDIMLFGQSVSQEYLNLFRTGVFSADELEEIRQNGLSASKATAS